MQKTFKVLDAMWFMVFPSFWGKEFRENRVLKDRSTILIAVLG